VIDWGMGKEFLVVCYYSFIWFFFRARSLDSPLNPESTPPWKTTPTNIRQQHQTDQSNNDDEEEEGDGFPERHFC
jgi:hypothetical protein